MPVTRVAEISNGVRSLRQCRPRVLIDASPVTKTIDGLAVYVVNLIKHLPKESLTEFDYTVLINPGIEWPDLTEAIREKGLKELRVSIAPIGPRRDWDMFRFLRRYGADFDLIHITSHNYPLAMRDGVLTMHDVTFRRWLDRRPGRPPGWAHAARAYLGLVVRNGLRRARRVIAVSESTRDELVAQFALVEEERAKIRVIHEGWEHLHAYQGECEPFAFEEGGYLFFLGSYRVHKNLKGLMEGFRLALDRIPDRKALVISGSSGRLSEAHRRLVAAINARGSRLFFTGYVSNACVARLYRRADAFILPSLAEGFGLPVLEALHYGAPLLCSNASSLPEVAGDAALYFNPTDPADIADAIVRFYGEPALAAKLRAKGRRRLRIFSWDKASRETVDLYRECLAG